jgi:hypothetical protein
MRISGALADSTLFPISPRLGPSHDKPPRLSKARCSGALHCTLRKQRNTFKSRIILYLLGLLRRIARSRAPAIRANNGDPLLARNQTVDRHMPGSHQVTAEHQVLQSST